METENRPLILALTGASGAVYGLTLIRKILRLGIPLHLLISSAAEDVLLQEAGKPIGELLETPDFKGLPGELIREDPGNLSSPVSSGSYRSRGMIIAPCSMGTLGRIAAGISGNLIERAADVCLKERRTLLLLTRETPLSAIHLDNMLRITHAGGIIMPPVPAFYSKPSSIQEMIDQTAERALDLFDLPVPGAYRWQGPGSGEYGDD